jgi:hypothetical protein
VDEPVWLASLFIPGIFYPVWYQPVLVGLVVSILGRIIEKLILKPGTVWLSNIADAVLAAVIIYYSQNFFPGAWITWGSALITSLILGVIEYGVHTLLVRANTEKPAT